MNFAHKILSLALIALVALTACDKAPDGVIKESKMAPLMADLTVAEAYIDSHPSQFATDSARMMIKQSVMMRHGVTLEQYEHSLDWYGHNLEIYTKVTEEAVKIVDERLKKQEGDLGHDLERRLADNKASHAGSRPIYPANGDTANIWRQPPTWALTGGMRSGAITFDLPPSGDSQKGDRYCLNFKLNAAGNKFNVLLAVDYNDGTTSFMHRGSCMEGWADYILQTDSARTIRRVYGYIGYNIKPSSIAFVDSIQLIRTRLNRNTYSTYTVQRFLGKQPEAGKPATVNSPATVPATAPTTAPKRTPLPPRSDRRL